MKISTPTLVVMAGICFLVVLFLLAPKLPTEKNRIAAANHEYYQSIFNRCQRIEALREFIALFHPTEALEFFDPATMREVVKVVSVKTIDERYKATFAAPVRVTSDGFYQLTGEPKFVIEDKQEKFMKISPTGRSRGHQIDLDPKLWSKFYESGGDIESLRTIYVDADDA